MTITSGKKTEEERAREVVRSHLPDYGDEYLIGLVENAIREALEEAREEGRREALQGRAVPEPGLLAIREHLADASSGRRVGLPVYGSMYTADVSLLLSALDEAHHLLWRMSQDSEAYLQGKEDGLALSLSVLEPRSDEAEKVRRLGAASAEPQQPPERARDEALRLRRGLRAIRDNVAAVLDGPVGVAGAGLLRGVLAYAREALGEGQEEGA